MLALTLLLLGVSFGEGGDPPAPWSDDPPAPWEHAPLSFGTPKRDTRYDPYHADGYERFLGWVKAGYPGLVLFVGVPDTLVNSYSRHYRVPSGFVFPDGGTVPDGVYSCFLMGDKPVMLRQASSTVPPAAPGVRQAAPFPAGEGITPTTTAPSAGPLSTLWTGSPGGSLTNTGVLRAGRLGFTSPTRVQPGCAAGG